MIKGVLKEAGSGRILVPRVTRTETFLERSKGLLGRKALPAEEGLLIIPCNSIHTLFMQFPLDVLFLDKDSRVVHVTRSLKPWRACMCLKASSVVELAAGVIDALELETGVSVCWEQG